MPIPGSENEFPKVLLTELGADAAVPDAGLASLYVLASDKLPYLIDDAGTITPLGVNVAPDADDVPYDNGSSGLTGDTVQEAIDELAGATVPTTHYSVVWDLGLTTGAKRPHRVADAGTIVRWTLMSDANVTISADLWVDDFASFPPDNSDSVTAAAPIAMATDNEADDTTLSGWTTALAAGDVLIPNVDAITPGSATYVVLVVDVER